MINAKRATSAPQPVISHRLVYPVGLIAVVLFGGAYAWHWSIPTKRTLDGTLLSVDATARAGILRFVHPKTGETFDLRGEIDSTCEITLDGAAADISALPPGISIRAEGMFYRSGRIVATRLDAHSAIPAQATTAAH